MGEGEAAVRPEDEADECLHCAIVDMVEERLAAGGADGANLAAHCGEPSGCILRVPGHEQAKLLAHTIAAVGELFLQKSGEDGGGSGSTH